MDTSNASEKKSKNGLFRKSVGHEYFNKIEIPSTSTKKKLRKSQGQIFNKDQITILSIRVLQYFIKYLQSSTMSLNLNLITIKNYIKMNPSSKGKPIQTKAAK